MYFGSILAIGKFHDCPYLITHSLLNGNTILYTENYPDAHVIAEESGTKLIVIGKINKQLKEVMNIGTFHVPIIITSGINGDNSIKDILFKKTQSAYFEDLEFQKINDNVKCVFNGISKGLRVCHELNYKKHNGGSIIEFSIAQPILDTRERIGKAIVFMSKHYKEDISIQKIAESAFFSPYHFSRLFKKQFGISCYKYLTNLRITKAKELLKDTEMLITNICYEVGFNDLTHFERTFNREEGLTPSAFRHSPNKKV